jgi:hypothetical protein
MKTIDTLIQDIYSTLEQGVDVSRADIAEALDVFANDARSAVATILQEGQRTGEGRLRLSQIGKPDRQIWYGVRGTEGEPLDGQTRIKFLMGHLLEALLIVLTQAAGHTVEGQQDEVEVEGVLGHQDCRIDGVLTDIKSASSFAFKKFKDGTLSDNDPFGYLSQLSAYATKNGDKEAAFFAIDKNSSELAILKVHDMEMIDAPSRVRALKDVVQMETAPDKCYSDTADGTSGNRKLVIGCVFCPYKKECWKDANNGAGLRAFKYSNGIRYLTTVARTPDVEEIKL